MSNETIVERFVDQAGRDDAKFLRPRSANITVANDGRTLYSYGSHFTLVRLMPASYDAPRGWWLLNGDSYSVSTARHQSIVRQAVRDDGRPFAIVSFDAMASAGIALDTIDMIDAQDDRMITQTRSAATIDGVPEYRRVRRYADVPDACSEDECDGAAWGHSGIRYGTCEHRRALTVQRVDTLHDYRETEGGRFEWDESRHVLGECVFSATVRDTRRDGEGRRVTVEYDAVFLSAFDHQESHLHYFLAELPAGAGRYGQGHLRVQSVDDAFRALRPDAVRRADANGTEVTRQGDMFAIPTTLTTRELTARGAVRERGGRIDGSSHVATEVARVGGLTYARGTLTHRPEGFRNPRTDPGHRRQRMGDARSWFLVVRNTVPRQGGSTGTRSVEPRSWTRGGNVD